MAAADADDVAVGQNRAPTYGLAVEPSAVAALAVFQPPLPILQDDAGMTVAGKAVVDHNRVADRTSQCRQRRQGESTVGRHKMTIDVSQRRQIAINRPRRFKLPLRLFETAPDEDIKRQQKAKQRQSSQRAQYEKDGFAAHKRALHRIQSLRDVIAGTMRGLVGVDQPGMPDMNHIAILQAVFAHSRIVDQRPAAALHIKQGISAETLA